MGSVEHCRDLPARSILENEMSRRFGRNQRRKMRNRIADLEAAYRMEQNLRTYIRRERDNLSHALGVVERVLGRHFVGLKPQTVRAPASDMGQPVRILPDYSPMLNPFSDPLVMLDVNTRCKTLEAWLLHSDVDMDALSNQVHIIVAYEGANAPRSAYFISQQAFASMYPDDLAMRLAPMLARSLLDGFKADRARA